MAVLKKRAVIKIFIPIFAISVDFFKHRICITLTWAHMHLKSK